MRKHLLAFALISSAFLSNGNAAPLTTRETTQLNQQLQQRRAQFKQQVPELLTYINRKMPKEEAEAMRFLVAYMPLSDITMHSGSYVHQQVKTSLQARSTFSWGKSIPDKIFRHFVLPYRINNEYTDTARQVFFKELRNRVYGLTMHDAALEVNHWCHEKVTYRGSDERTSGPLTSVRTAHGRCGEESTFTVAALRSVGIPARQVYTPRWAHTDDNHAWVEVWIDGQWHFMGACEPEADLDLGWFAAPVKRAMMTHSVVFGKYSGAEEKLQTEPLYTRINLLSNYTKTRKVNVKVVDANGNPEPQAKVKFMIYNYAEFYPIATKYTSSKGSCSAETGFGDFIVWSSKAGRYGYTKVAANSQDTVVVTLSAPIYNNRKEQVELVPPPSQPINPANPVKAALNNSQLHIEDSIRNCYVATFTDSTSIARIAASNGFRTADLLPFFKQSRGNWREVEAFITSLNSNNRHIGIALLKTLAEKDYHDITAAILTDHLACLPSVYPVSDTVEKYVWGLRVGKEMITCWRSFLLNSFTTSQKRLFSQNPEALKQWIKSELTIDTTSNYYNVPLSPESVIRYRVADRYSRNLLFVTTCRSLGVPSRFEPATSQPQYLKNGTWHNVQFEVAKPVQRTRGTITLSNPSTNTTFTPQYYSQYTIARFDNGQFTTLDYEGSSEVAKFPCTLSLDAGYYRVMTGNRLNDGSVLCNISYFNLDENAKVECPIEIRPIIRSSEVLGKANLEASFSPLSKNPLTKLSDHLSQKGVVVATIEPDKEPTKHLIEDLKAVKERIEQWGGTILLIVRSGTLTPSFNPQSYTGMPQNIIWGYDSTGDLGNAIDLMCGNNGGAQAPQVSIINANGEIIFYSEGYSIGMGETILKNLVKR